MLMNSTRQQAWQEQHWTMERERLVLGVVMQWAERKLEDGSQEQWGDKWDERFKDGSGNKTVRPNAQSQSA